MPSVVVTTTGFTRIARAVGRAEGMASLRVAEYPGAVGVHPNELVVKNVETVLFERIVENLTRAPAVESSDPAAIVRRADAIVHEGSFEEINDYFRSREW